MSLRLATLSDSVFAAFFLIPLIILTIIMTMQAKKGKLPFVRRFAALDAVDRSIDNCAELGKPLVYNCASTAMRADQAPMVIASLSILSYVARKCAKVGCRLIVGYEIPTIAPMLSGILKTAAKEEGKQGFFKEEDLHFLTSDGNAAGLLTETTLFHEDAQAMVLFGHASLEVPCIIEASAKKGITCIMGTAYMTFIHGVALLTDYSLIGEELYAAGAMLKNDAQTLTTLRLQDIFKVIFLGMIPVTAILIRLGVKLV